MVKGISFKARLSKNDRNEKLLLYLYSLNPCEVSKNARDYHSLIIKEDPKVIVTAIL